MNHVRNMLERTALRASRVNPAPPVARFADVKSYDAKRNLVTVTVDNSFSPDNSYQSTELGPMPLIMPLGGNNYGMQAGIEPGTQIVVLSMSTDGDQYIALGITNTVKSIPPNTSIGVGEWQVTNRANTAVSIKSATEGTIQVGNISTITGNPNRILREKDIYPLITALNSARAVFNAHVHSGVTTGAGSSAIPTTTEATYTNPAGSTTAKAGD